jgi:rod shape-determining protein MreD
MRKIAVAWALALAGLFAVGALGLWMPRGWLPDPAFLVALAAGLHLPGVPGVVAAAGAGWSADVLSGGPLGVNGLLDLLVWVAARAGQRRVDLARPSLLVPFAAALGVLHLAGTWALAGLPVPHEAALVAIALPRLALDALCAPAARYLLQALLGRVDVEEPARGTLRIGAGAGTR